ncbi:MAG: T9SS type A sorting domain-containing protein [Flavobacteriales bacterium]
MEKTEFPALHVFPNPVHGQVFIQSSENISALSYRIINVLGENVQSGTMSTSIDVLHLSPGIYFLEISSGNAVYSVKKLLVESEP